MFITEREHTYHGDSLENGSTGIRLSRKHPQQMSSGTQLLPIPIDTCRVICHNNAALTKTIGVQGGTVDSFETVCVTSIGYQPLPTF